ncbi:MAG: glycosyltransferase family 2 protein [Pseudomonadota bacterium]
MILISVIIVNYNSGQYLQKSVESLFKQIFRQFEIIIIDNASSDNSASIINNIDDIDNMNQYDDIKITRIFNEENIGFAAANNKAVKIAQGDLLIFLNPDTITKIDWLKILYQYSLKNPKIAMFGSTQICAENHNKLDGTGDIYHILGIPLRSNYGHDIKNIPPTNEIFAPCAAAAMIRRQYFEQVNGFDEKFFCYCEDIDLAFRLRLIGQTCLQIKEAIIYHHGSAITGRQSKFSIYYGMRNRIWVLIKNMPLSILILILPLHLLITFIILLTYLKRGNFLAAARGYGAAIVNIRPIIAERKLIQATRSASYWALMKSFTYSFNEFFKRMKL